MMKISDDKEENTENVGNDVHANGTKTFWDFIKYSQIAKLQLKLLIQKLQSTMDFLFVLQQLMR